MISRGFRAPVYVLALILALAPFFALAAEEPASPTTIAFPQGGTVSLDVDKKEGVTADTVACIPPPGQAKCTQCGVINFKSSPGPKGKITEVTCYSQEQLNCTPPQGIRACEATDVQEAALHSTTNGAQAGEWNDTFQRYNYTTLAGLTPDGAQLVLHGFLNPISAGSETTENSNVSSYPNYGLLVDNALGTAQEEEKNTYAAYAPFIGSGDIVKLAVTPLPSDTSVPKDLQMLVAGVPSGTTFSSTPWTVTTGEVSSRELTASERLTSWVCNKLFSDCDTLEGQQAAQNITDWTPGLGTASAGSCAYDSFTGGNWFVGSLCSAAAIASVIPGAGPLGKLMKEAAIPAREGAKVAEPALKGLATLTERLGIKAPAEAIAEAPALSGLQNLPAVAGKQAALPGDVIAQSLRQRVLNDSTLPGFITEASALVKQGIDPAQLDTLATRQLANQDVRRVISKASSADILSLGPISEKVNAWNEIVPLGTAAIDDSGVKADLFARASREIAAGRASPSVIENFIRKGEDYDLFTRADANKALKDAVRQQFGSNPAGMVRYTTTENIPIIFGGKQIGTAKRVVEVWGF